MVKANLGFEFSHTGLREDLLPLLCLGFPLGKVGIMIVSASQGPSEDDVGQPR